ncbi:hypothetical protein ABH15_10550 [Methanoculleus taiwanensis]|uniref:Uncharacterized protein n=1 Tax=Methanoculleus taiwanensis TaxID=1550565 RepID=A0A498GXL4_9EURY|nr:hypothetical protein ABH15_10550 [Methanoculleus taiwanensis]
MNPEVHFDPLNLEDRSNLESTAALVIFWARDLYRTGSATRFYSILDLSESERTRHECDEACPWCGQVTLNRK